MSVEGQIYVLSFLIFLGLIVGTSGTFHHFASLATSDDFATCSRACMLDEEHKNVTLSIIKKEILAKMGWASPPVIPDRIKANVPPLAQLLDTRRHHFRFGEGMLGDQPTTEDGSSSFRTGAVPQHYSTDNFFVKKGKIIALLKHDITVPAGLEHLPILQFAFGNSPQNDNIESALLWVYVNGTHQNNNTGASSGSVVPVLNVDIFKVASVYPKLRPFLSTTVTAPEEHGEWIAIDVTDLVTEWYTRPRRNLGLYITVTDVEGNNKIVTETQSPYIDIITSEKTKRRARREIVSLDCDADSSETRCCRFPLEVDFEKFGWDFVIAPKKYDAYYCSGECPYAFLQRYPYTHIISQMTKKPRPASPCCSPRKMGSMTMLYFSTQNTIQLSEIQNMVVGHCGCF